MTEFTNLKIKISHLQRAAETSRMISFDILIELQRLGSDDENSKNCNISIFVSRLMKLDKFQLSFFNFSQQ